MDDVIFDKIFRETLSPIFEVQFPSKITGVTHFNSDGSDRSLILSQCEPFEFFDLEHEPDNPVDPKAVAVYRHNTREQVGYLPERTAHDLLARVPQEGGNWCAILHEFNRHPRTKNVVGVNILILRARDEQAKR